MHSLPGILKKMLKLRLLNTAMQTNHKSSGIKMVTHMLLKKIQYTSQSKEYVLNVLMLRKPKTKKNIVQKI